MYRIVRTWPLLVCPILLYPLDLFLINKINILLLHQPPIVAYGYDYFVAIPVVICWTLALCLGKVG